MRKRLVLTALLNALGAGCGIAIALIITPFALRLLGKDSYGVWVLITSFSVASGYLSFLDFGVQSGIVKYVSEHWARQEVGQINQVFTAGLCFFVGIGALGCGTLVAFSWLLLSRVFNIPAEQITTVRLLLYILAVQTLVEFPSAVFSAVLDGLQRYDVQRLIQIGYVAANGATILVLLSTGYGLLALGLSALFLSILRSAVLVVMTRRFFPALHFVREVEGRLLRRIASYSWRVFLLRLNGLIYNNMDKAIIGILLTSTLLVEYDIASKLRNLAMVTLSFITPQIVPASSHLAAGDNRSESRVLFIVCTKYQLAACVPMVVSILVLAEEIIGIWIGPDYIYIAGLARLCVVYLLLEALVVVGYNIMIGTGNVKPLLLIQSLTTTGLNLCVSVLLTPHLGVAGVMWGTLAGAIAATPTYLWMYFRTLQIAWAQFWRKVVFPVFAAAGVFSVVLYFANAVVMPDSLLSLLGVELIGLAVYGLLFFLWGMDPSDRSFAMQTARLRWN